MVFRRFFAIYVHNQQFPVTLMQDGLEPKALVYPCAFQQTRNGLLSTFPHQSWLVPHAPTGHKMIVGNPRIKIEPPLNPRVLPTYPNNFIFHLIVSGIFHHVSLQSHCPVQNKQFCFPINCFNPLQN